MFRKVIFLIALLAFVLSASLAQPAPVVTYPAAPNDVQVDSITPSGAVVTWKHDRLKTVWYEVNIWTPNRLFRYFIFANEPLSYRLTALTPATIYKVRVAAVNHHEITNTQWPTWSPIIEFTTQGAVTPPTPTPTPTLTPVPIPVPTNLRVIDVAKRTALLAWDYSGTPLRFEVTVWNATETHTCTVDPSIRECRIKKIRPGTTYSAHVTAVLKHGAAQSVAITFATHPKKK